MELRSTISWRPLVVGNGDKGEEGQRVTGERGGMVRGARCGEGGSVEEGAGGGGEGLGVLLQSRGTDNEDEGKGHARTVG